MYRHRNTSSHPVCFDVDLTTSHCSQPPLAQANRPFTPLNPSSLNYLGDAGYNNSVQSFSFTVRGRQRFDVVISQGRSPQQVCHYKLTVHSVP